MTPSHTGHCHCGAVQLTLPSTPERATDCNCSLCRRIGGPWVYFTFGSVRIEAEPGVIADYVQGDRTLRTCFCRRCGCVTHWEPIDAQPGSKHGVNLGNFDPALIASVHVRRFDGADTWRFLDEPAAAQQAAAKAATVVCRRAGPDDFTAVGRLLELYQYELSDLWDQQLDAQGTYGYDLSRHRQGSDRFAYLALAAGHPAGVALVCPAGVTRREGWWMEQFFVLSRYRRSGLGRKLAQHVFAAHPGAWEVGQMPGNGRARMFWRRIAGEVARGAVEEQTVSDGAWQGTVQRFDVGG